MTEQEIMQAFLAYAQKNGTQEPSGEYKLNLYRIDMRGTLSHCEFNDSIMISFGDMSAYYAPNRKVTYCEGDAELLKQHWEMTGSPLAVAIYYL